MRTFRTFVLAALALLSGLGAQAALAGEWVETKSGDPNMRAIAYRGSGMLPGEEVVLKYSGPMRDDSGALINVITMVLFLSESGQGTISGFDGVTLRAGTDGADQLVLYGLQEHHDKDDMNVFLGIIEPWQGCYESALYNVELNNRVVPSICVHSCYESAEDARADRDYRACSKEGGKFIGVLVSGVLLLEARGDHPALADSLARATHLIAGVKHGKYVTMSFDLDQTFHRALLGR